VNMIRQSTWNMVRAVQIEYSHRGSLAAIR
jgi:hypothetical protein